MAVKIQWKTSGYLSGLHAAAAYCGDQPLVDAQTAAAMVPWVETIRDRLGVADVNVTKFWHSMIAQGKRGKDQRGRVEIALGDAGCGSLAADSLATMIAGLLSDLQLAYAHAFPRLEQQLPLRAGPLREQWDARGPGFMAVVGKLTHRDLMPKRAEVTFVQPATGGGGGASPEHRLVWFEAMLTNPHDDVPEVLRLGWLLAQIGLGHRSASKLVAPEHLPKLSALALLPIVIDAGQEVEMIGHVDVARLIDVWNLRRTASELSPGRLQQWWSQLRSSNTPFPVGFKALQTMLNS